MPPNAYSPDFDLPEFKPRPLLTYMIATIPRTGSTLLSHTLWKTGQLGVPLEYLNFLPASIYPNLRGHPDRQREHWNYVRSHRTTSNGVFGHKVFVQMLAELKRDNPTLLADMKSNYIIYLRRRDKGKQARSYARATMTGQWTANQEANGRVEISDRAALAAMESEALSWIATQEGVWEAMFRSAGHSPLNLFYEDFADDPSHVAQVIAGYLGIELNPEMELNVPSVRRQGTEEVLSVGG